MKKAFTIKETVELTGISKTMLYNQIKKGRLKACKIGRRTIIRENDLDSFLGGLSPIN